MENNLRNTFKQKYDREQWQSVLIGIMGDDKINYSLTPKSIALTDTQLTKIEKILKIGTIQTSDRKELPVFEIHLNPSVIIERNRVTVNEIIKQYLIKDARDGAIAVFYYPDYQKAEWRFSFISPGSENGFFEELKIESTNSKRYSYVFGVAEEEHRTAVRQFIQLSESKKTLNDFFEAFNVEKMSKEFFDEYKEHYLDFIQFVTGTRIVNQKEQVVHNPHNYFINVFGGDKKRVRDFMKKLLGRIIFLYFIQKKGWLGASSISYKDGDKNFLQNFFNQSANEAFYPNWLSKLFFDTLNKKRDNDNFELPDGSIVKIPFLNGGLFDKVNTKYDWLTFSPSLFQNLFNFLNRYNFTIYEDSPDDHTVAVDPEMLGHIFENLLEDNKDKGAFYTPKEIVQFMTQESLIEYLHTHLPTLDKKYLTLLVKYKSLDNIQELKDKISDIDYLLDKVKICDPAIGSGAFPMGLLQEIFSLKDLLMHEKGFDISDKARVKEHIIQNSIYGVDIEQGAVDIARLRFWLSLVVYEDIPKPLPNLDFKIVAGDSLLSKFEDQILHIDWEVKSAKTGKMIAADIRKELSQLSQKQKEYFESANKATLNQEIRELKLGIIEKQIRFNQLQYNEYNSVQGNIFEGKLKRSAKQDTEVQSFGLLLNKIASLRVNPDKELQFFDWKLNFPEVLNPAVVGENPGFDIVIGNPPYLRVQGIRKDNPQYADILTEKFEAATGSFDLYAVFTEKALQLTNRRGLLNFIMPVKWTNAAFGKGLRGIIQKESLAYKTISFSAYQVFNASTYTGLQWFKRDSQYLQYNELNRDLKTNSELKDYLFSLNDKSFTKIECENLTHIPWVLTNSSTSELLDKIKQHSRTIDDIFEKIFQGIATSKDSVYFLFDCYDNGQTITGLSKELNRRVEIEKGLVKPLLKGDDVHRYCDIITDKVVIFPYKYIQVSGKDLVELYTEIEISKLYPKGYLYLKECEFILKERENGRLINDAYWFRYIYPKNQLHFKKEKLISPDISMGGNFTYDIEGKFYSTTTLYGYIKRSTIQESYKFLMAILNSKVLWWYLVNTGTILANGYFRFKPDYLKPFPIPELSNIEKETPFKILVDYILFLKAEDEPINDFVPNSHIAETFEEVIDAMVFELYFPEDFKKAGIHFIEYAERDFIPIEGKTPEEQKEIIHNAYQKSREKDNEIRNNLKLMDTRLENIVMPIKSV
jgi:hypothetical protein